MISKIIKPKRDEMNVLSYYMSKKIVLIQSEVWENVLEVWDSARETIIA